jgi:hypothetical protein
LYNHDNCREFHSPKLCALAREDKKCLKKIHKNVKRKAHKYLILDKEFLPFGRVRTLILWLLKKYENKDKK